MMKKIVSAYLFAGLAACGAVAPAGANTLPLYGENKMVRLLGLNFACGNQAKAFLDNAQILSDELQAHFGYTMLNTVTIMIAADLLLPETSPANNLNACTTANSLMMNE